MSLRRVALNTRAVSAAIRSPGGQATIARAVAYRADFFRIHGYEAPRGNSSKYAKIAGKAAPWVALAAAAILTAASGGLAAPVAGQIVAIGSAAGNRNKSAAGISSFLSEPSDGAPGDPGAPGAPGASASVLPIIAIAVGIGLAVWLTRK